MSKLPTTPEIEACGKSRQRKLQMRAKLAGICGTCITRPVSIYYPASERCDECRAKDMVRWRKRTNCKRPQPWRLQPQKTLIMDAMKSLSPEELGDNHFIEALADSLKCPSDYLKYIRLKVFGIKLQRGAKLGSKHKKHEKDTTKAPISQEG